MGLIYSPQMTAINPNRRKRRNPYVDLIQQQANQGFATQQVVNQREADLLAKQRKQDVDFRNKQLDLEKSNLNEQKRQNRRNAEMQKWQLGIQGAGLLSNLASNFGLF